MLRTKSCPFLRRNNKGFWRTIWRNLAQKLKWKNGTAQMMGEKCLKSPLIVWQKGSVEFYCDDWEGCLSLPTLGFWLVCCFCSLGSRTGRVRIVPVVAFHSKSLIFHQCSWSFPATPWNVVTVGTARFVVPVCQCLEPAELDWHLQQQQGHSSNYVKASCIRFRGTEGSCSPAGF